MVELFSTPWLARYKALWNGEPELADALARVGFEARIGYGYKGENDPRALLVVENRDDGGNPDVWARVPHVREPNGCV